MKSKPRVMPKMRNPPSERRRSFAMIAPGLSVCEKELMSLAGLLSRLSKRLPRDSW